MIQLFWLPLGAGGHFVKYNGRAYEALKARLEHRPPFDLYHSALRIASAGRSFVFEQAPVRDRAGRTRGVVAEGPVGARPAGRLRIFRYEIRLWPGGEIPDVSEAVDSPRLLSDDPGRARELLELAPQIPTPVWGRDQLGLGEMWNSNSAVAWLLASGGIDARAIEPPAGGRAPGWAAGLAMAERS